MIIDAHNHLLDEPNYTEHFLRGMDACGIDKCCLSGLGKLFGFAENEDVRKAFTAHPDRLIGQIFVRPGVDGSELIDRGADEGFRMVKITVPRVPYDDPSLYPLWERALARNMPVLFHTGIIAPFVEGRGEGISSWHMHPMRIEHITREFPDLPVIVAHLGVNWNQDAAELARMRPNLYVDLTGEPGGWRDRADRFGMDTWLWWPDAFKKVIFGTDVNYTKLQIVLDQDLARFDNLKIDEETRAGCLSGTILRLLGEE